MSPTSEPRQALQTLLVFDDVLSDPVGYRQQALEREFADITLGADTFRGIAFAWDDTLLEAVVERFGSSRLTMPSFFRRSPLGQAEPNYIHSDKGEGEWTALLYLNPTPAKGDGTTFWARLTDNAIGGDFEQDEARDLSRWAPWEKVDAKFNRLLVFRSELFHSRALFDNYGVGEGARLVQVAFGVFA